MPSVRTLAAGAKAVNQPTDASAPAEPATSDTCQAVAVARSEAGDRHT